MKYLYIVFMLQKATPCYTVDQQPTIQYYYDTFIFVTGPTHCSVVISISEASDLFH